MNVLWGNEIHASIRKGEGKMKIAIERAA